jgi:hypothetical protein
MSDASVDDWFDGKPDTKRVFQAVQKQLDDCGPSDLTVGKQIGFGAKRKFAWFWLYNVTGKTPQGVLHLQLALSEKVDDPHVRAIAQVGKSRWNHQVVIRTEADASSAWLGKLIKKAYEYGQG